MELQCDQLTSNCLGFTNLSRFSQPEVADRLEHPLPVVEMFLYMCAVNVVLTRLHSFNPSILTVLFFTGHNPRSL